MRDEILTRRENELPAVYYHILAWTFFIAYEVLLSAAIRGSYNHVSDYILRYPLYIALFYVHCYVLLGKVRLRTMSNYIQLLVFLCLEIASYYLCHVIINEYLVSSGLPVNIIDTWSLLFALGTLYRFIYIASLSTGLRIAINLIKSQKRNLEFVTETLTHEKEKESLRAEAAAATASFLRSQINPHFLFNSLNSVYNRVRKKDPVSAEYVMALADQMRYALRSQEESTDVPLQSELDHISNYIILQNMRYATDMEFLISGDATNLRIGPLLLITLIENVFQHGELKHLSSKPEIKVTITDHELILTTKNLIRNDRRPGNGVGLANTRKRLDLEYPEKFLLEYSEVKNIFYLKLHLKLK